MTLDLVRNIFAGNPLDRAGDKRGDAGWIEDRWTDPRSLVAVLSQGAPLLEAGEGEALRIAYLPGGVLDAPAERRLFLGRWKEAAVFAADLSEGLDSDARALLPDARFEELRLMALRLPETEAGIVATAKAVFEWSGRHRFCGVCGAPTVVEEAGWRRRCTRCGTQHFPRTDPVAIMLPVFGDRCLLGRQAAWPKGMFSALAGFVEPGESFEDAAARELKEEAGLDAVRLAYHSTQPWPYPCNLMVGLIAEVASDTAQADGVELEQVRWFSREEARALVRGEIADAWAPSKLAIAGVLLRAWAGEDQAG